MELETLLFKALAAEYGVSLTTSDSTKLRAKLYPLRKTNPAFAQLHFVIPPINPTTTLWVVKKTGDS